LAIILAVALVYYLFFARNILLLAVLVGSPLYRFNIWWRYERKLEP
jgi:hypothetical protein